MSSQPKVGEDRIPVLRIMNALLQRRHIVLAAALGALLLSTTLVILQGRQWTSSASFVPEARSYQTGISSLAAQFGFALPASTQGLPAAFYAQLIRSRGLLGTLARESFSSLVSGETRQTPLPTLMGTQDEDQSRTVEETIRRLERAVGASTAQRTGVIRVSVTTPDPLLSKQLLERILALVDLFNLQTRQSRARQEREFIEDRVVSAQQELRQAEDRLEIFLNGNRDFSNSPQLSFEQDRLARDVTMRQHLYTTLAEALAQAEIEEVRDTPVITVVEPPELPVYPDPRGIVLRSFLALFLGGALGTGIALVMEGSGRMHKAEPDDFNEFTRLRTSLWRDLRAPWRLLAPPR